MLFEGIQNNGENKNHATCYVFYVLCAIGSQMQFVFSITETHSEWGRNEWKKSSTSEQFKMAWFRFEYKILCKNSSYSELNEWNGCSWVPSALLYHCSGSLIVVFVFVYCFWTKHFITLTPTRMMIQNNIPNERPAQTQSRTSKRTKDTILIRFNLRIRATNCSVCNVLIEWQSLFLKSDVLIQIYHFVCFDSHFDFVSLFLL